MSKYWSSIESGGLPSVGLGAIYSIAVALDTNLDYFFVDSIEQNKEVTYEEINDLLEDMTPDQRVIAMDLVKFVSDNSDKIK